MKRKRTQKIKQDPLGLLKPITKRLKKLQHLSPSIPGPSSNGRRSGKPLLSPVVVKPVPLTAPEVKKLPRAVTPVVLPVPIPMAIDPEVLGEIRRKMEVGKQERFPLAKVVQAGGEFCEEEDALIVGRMILNGVSPLDFRGEVRKSNEFLFDFFLQCHGVEELERRRNALVRFVKKEMDENSKAEQKALREKGKREAEEVALVKREAEIVAKIQELERYINSAAAIAFQPAGNGVPTAVSTVPLPVPPPPPPVAVVPVPTVVAVIAPPLTPTTIAPAAPPMDDRPPTPKSSKKSISDSSPQSNVNNASTAEVNNEEDDNDNNSDGGGGVNGEYDGPLFIDEGSRQAVLTTVLESKSLGMTQLLDRVIRLFPDGSVSKRRLKHDICKLAIKEKRGNDRAARWYLRDPTSSSRHAASVVPPQPVAIVAVSAIAGGIGGDAVMQKSDV